MQLIVTLIWLSLASLLKKYVNVVSYLLLLCYWHSTSTKSRFSLLRMKAEVTRPVHWARSFHFFAGRMQDREKVNNSLHYNYERISLELEKLEETNCCIIFWRVRIYSNICSREGSLLNSSNRLWSQENERRNLKSRIACEELVHEQSHWLQSKKMWQPGKITSMYNIIISACF